MTNDLVVGDLLTRNKLIKAKAISPLTFFFENSFLILKLTTSKAATGGVKLKSCPETVSIIHSKTPVFESLFKKVVGLQDCCKIYLLHENFFFR